MTKQCRVCEKSKKLEKFVRLSKSEDGFTNICKKCHRANQKKYRQNNPDSYKSAKLKSKYGITLNEVNYMKEKQGHKCAICTNDSDLCVDHCHTTNAVRGLICTGCNKFLGFAKDNPDVLYNAIKYLVKNGKE